jgi:hypothetical protein
LNILKSFPYPFTKGFSGLMLIATYLLVRLARRRSVVYTLLIFALHHHPISRLTSPWTI